MALAACGCGGEAPASTRAVVRPASSATEWTGARAQPAGAAAPADSAAPATATDRGTWVLHIGDSFTDASFQQNLAPRVRASGAAYVADARTATYTTTWAYDAQLDEKLARRPSLVIVTLGANEVDIPYPSVHAGAVERIVRRIKASGASCVWTTPPLWHGESGILQVIHDHCAPCVYFDSDAVLGGGLRPDERQRDGIHPNTRGGARWADAFWGWLNDHRDASRPGWRVVPFERREPYAQW
jgi:lysophospholipase L1-like esterase